MILLFEEISALFRPQKLIFLKQPGQVKDEKNITSVGQQFVKLGKIGRENIEESKTLNVIAKEPRQNVKFKSAHLLCCNPSL